MTDAIEPAVSVVIPAHNAAETLRAQLDAIVPQAEAPGVEIVVVDNLSSDATRAIVDEYATRFPNVRAVSAVDKRGPSYTRNVGARAARGEFVLFADADDIVSPTWLSSLVAALRDHDYVGGPIEVGLLNPGWLADGRGRWGVDQPGTFGDLPFAHGCNLGMRRAVYLDAGGLDEELWIGEEIDLAIRLRRQGLLLHFVPEAVVHYRYRSGWKVIAKQAYSYGRATPLLLRRGEIPAEARQGTRGGRRLLWLVANVPSIRDRAGRVRWLWTAGSAAGLTVGRIADRRN